MGASGPSAKLALTEQHVPTHLHNMRSLLGPVQPHAPTWWPGACTPMFPVSIYAGEIANPWRSLNRSAISHACMACHIMLLCLSGMQDRITFASAGHRKEAYFAIRVRRLSRSGMATPFR